MPIVIVDDCAMTMAILKGISGARGERHVIGITDALLAIAHLRANAADCVVLDYSMPGLDGISMTRMLRETTLHASTPIIMLTGAEDKELEQSARAAGVTEFLRKPVKLGVFKALLAAVLRGGGWPLLDRRQNSAGTFPPEGERRQRSN